MKHFSRIIYRSYSSSSGHEERWMANPHGVAWQPLADVYERPDGMVIVVELPGVAKSEIEVSVEGACLKVKGVRRKNIPADTQRVHQMEIPYGPFARAVELPGYADLEHIEADFENGYLTVTVPRTAG